MFVFCAGRPCIIYGLDLPSDLNVEGVRLEYGGRLEKVLGGNVTLVVCTTNDRQKYNHIKLCIVCHMSLFSKQRKLLR